MRSPAVETNAASSDRSRPVPPGTAGAPPAVSAATRSAEPTMRLAESTSRTSEVVLRSSESHSARGRRPMPRRCTSRTTSFRINGAPGYLTAGVYPDGHVGEVFVRLGKQGSTLSGMADALGIVTTLALQYGAPLPLIVERLRGQHFEPAGLTDDTEIPRTTSVVDYIARRLEIDYLGVAGPDYQTVGPRPSPVPRPDL
jgi:ribonucleoside-diphosphate reductase alpha chain